jgi:hypothetical protein
MWKTFTASKKPFYKLYVKSRMFPSYKDSNSKMCILLLPCHLQPRRADCLTISALMRWHKM